MILVVVFVGACTQSGEPTGETGFAAALSPTPYMPSIDPARFVADIDNRYLPLKPGTTHVFEGESEGEKEVVTVTVTSEEKRIPGVDCVVVRDEVKTEGKLSELTFDWYVQDEDGNVWYFWRSARSVQCRGGRLGFTLSRRSRRAL